MTDVDPITDYDILERALGKLTMASPNEHARGVAALHRIRDREMNGGDPDAGRYVSELEDAVSDLKKLDEEATLQLMEQTAELLYLRAAALLQDPCVPWEEISPELQDAWREHAAAS